MRFRLVCQYVHSVKPQMASSVLDSDAMRAALADKVLVSICAGVTIWQFKQWLPRTGTPICATLMCSHYSRHAQYAVQDWSRHDGVGDCCCRKPRR